ncbi:MAG: hypothetical protein IKE64_05815, partial [Thermoguttaceae bacterium]|nr:hypothetical protein [Thermoguttaceae bacterium]
MRINRKNTRPLMKHGWPRIVIFLLTLVMSCAAVGKENQEKLLRTLKNQIDEYLRKVEFKCTYTFSKYLVDSKEEAESFDTSNGTLLLRGTGSLIKSKTMTLESFVMDQAIPEEGFTRGHNHITVTNLDLRAHYVRQTGLTDEAPNRTIFVMKEEKTDGGIQLLTDAYAPISCPLTYGGGRAFLNCLGALANTQKSYPTTFSISHDKENTTISQHTDFSTEETDTVLVLSNEYRYPILLRRTTTTHKHAIDADVYGTTAALDLVDVGKGFVVPKKVYSFTGPMLTDILGEGTKGKWIVRKWESEDLGEEPPKAEDFLIPLERDTDFAGLNLDLVYQLNHHVPE